MEYKDSRLNGLEKLKHRWVVCCIGENQYSFGASTLNLL
jgi:hypothetical protein